MNDPRTVSASVGAAVPHDSAEGHVSGTAVYVDDLALPVGTLHVATGFADIACGRLESLDLDAVRGAAGVRDVIVAADVPGELDIGAVFPGDPLLADSSIRYHGQPLFAVAAESLRLAQQAVRLAHISVESEAAPLNVAESLAAGAFVLPSRTWEYHGDSDRDPAAVQVEGEMYLRGQEHFYLEGQAALALPGEDDTMVVVSSTQHPDEVQHQVAAVLGIAMHKVRVQCRRMGGGFGGKETQAAPLACLAALLARRTGRAVKYRMPRHDDMIQTGKRHDFAASFRLEADADGHIRHYDVILAGKCGHSPDLSDGIVDRAMFHALNAYYAPSARITGHRCRTATVSNTAFRGFGGPQGMVVIEAAMDELAFATGIDRLELRKRNLYAPGRDVTPYGQTVKQHVLAEIIADLETRCDYRARQEAARAFNAAHRHFKKGLALTPVQFGISFTAIHLNQAGALLHVYRDGSVGLSHGGTEMGQGLYVKVRQVVARSLGLPLQRIELSGAETDKVPNASATAASSGSDLNGMAALAACRTIKARLAEFLRAELNWPGAPIQFADGEIRCGDQSLTFAEAAAAAHRARISLSATGFYRTPDIHFDKDAGKGQPFFYYANGAAASEVAIDTLTGEYRVLRTDIVHDVGDSLNPAIDLGQIEGGFVQGLGWLTTEELLWNDEGRLISDSPANYKIPTAHDCPEILNVTLYDGANPEPTLFRSKAVGEPPLLLAISAWCALRDACSAAGDYRTLAPLAVPATPEAVFHAVQAVGEAADALVRCGRPLCRRWHAVRAGDGADDHRLGAAGGGHQDGGDRGHGRRLHWRWSARDAGLRTGPHAARRWRWYRHPPFPLAAATRQCCGGSVTVLIEAFAEAALNVAVFGAGHVGRRVVAMLEELDVRLQWFDTRPDMAPPGPTPCAAFDDPAAVVDRLDPHQEVLVLTHDHQLDFALITALLSRGFTRIGLIGSRTKWQRFSARLEAAGFTPDQLGHVRCPVGAGLPGKQPMAVAVAIVAELLAAAPAPGEPLERLSWRQIKESLVRDDGG